MAVVTSIERSVICCCEVVDFLAGLKVDLFECDLVAFVFTSLPGLELGEALVELEMGNALIPLEVIDNELADLIDASGAPIVCKDIELTPLVVSCDLSNTDAAIVVARLIIEL